MDNLDLKTCDAKHYDTELKNFYLQVSKAGTKTFYYRIKLNGKDNSYKLGRYPDITVIQARNLATKSASEVASGIDPQKKRVDRRKQDKYATLKGYIDNIYADYLITENKSGDKMLN
ncbi:MAG: DUF4102 domain-containing protein [Gammaproteobacteria bacterium]|nr:DUF4102 domain-containing protein [Gammaproteobacteria bacterium]